LKPCDYCFARGLDCGPKLPTPRKLAEMNGLAVMPGASMPLAIAQPLTSGPFSAQLQVQIPVKLSGGLNLSSVRPDHEMPFTLSSPITPSNPSGYPAYSSLAGFASLMSPVSLGIAVPQRNPNIAQPWSSQSSAASQCSATSPEFSPEASPSPELGRRDSLRPALPPHHPAHTLNASILGIVNSALPHYPASDTENAETSSASEDESWEECQRAWLQFHETSPGDTEHGMLNPFRLPLNRLLHIPKSTAGRKLAGKWDEDILRATTGKQEREKSIKSAPSILC
jgi:hypothetical protein